MFRSVQLIYHKLYKQLTIHDEQGRTVVDHVEFGKLVTYFLSDQFRGEIEIGISAFIGELRPLEHPITGTEVERSLKQHTS